jgi:hypothetical protein
MPCLLLASFATNNTLTAKSPSGFRYQFSLLSAAEWLIFFGTCLRIPEIHVLFLPKVKGIKTCYASLLTTSSIILLSCAEALYQDK